MALAQMSPSEELVGFWNDILEPKFTRYRHVLIDGLSRHSETIFPKLPVTQGDNVLDVGCGFGDTAIQLARRVGPDGCVIGVDCVDGFLAFARKDAAAEGLDNVEFQLGDAQTAPFEPKFDFVFSRFGTMFFANPVVALRNIRGALKPGAPFTMIVWRTIEDNPWLKLPKDVTLGLLPPPPPDGQSCGPGPFSMADAPTVRGQFKSAGFGGDIAFERIDAPIRVGETIADAIGLQLALGPAGEIYREAGEIAHQRHEALFEALTDALRPYASEDGVYLESSSWMITAYNPRTET